MKVNMTVFKIFSTTAVLGSILLLSGCSTSSTPSSLSFGTNVNKNSQNLTVSGTQYSPNANIYLRVFDSQPFGNTKLIFLLEKQDGSGWTQVDQENFSVNPNDDVEVMPFYVTATGTYQVTILNGNQTIASNQFTAQ